MIKERFVVIDLETTGNQVKNNDRIIQIGAVVIENEEIVDRYMTYINPNRPINSFIQNLTGISDEMLVGAPSFQEVGHDIVHLLRNSYFVAHNISFDLPFLKAELSRCGLPTFKGPQIDTVELARILFPNLNGYKLNDLAEFFNISHTNPHRADSDAEVTAKIFLQFIKKIRDLPKQTLHQLNKVTPYLIGDLTNLFSEILIQKKQNSDRFENIHDFAVLKKIETEKNNDKKNVNFDYLNKVSDLLKKAYDQFEQREGQLKMVELIDYAYKQNQHLIVEAGTGIGKSMGYLLPSIFFSKQQQTPVVISTYTLNLQQQLIEKEIAILNKILPFPINVTILKGRHHYLCLKKFKQHFESFDEDNYDAILTKAQILVWLTETMTGDLDELNIPSGGIYFWDKVKSDGYTCENHSSSWAEGCFFTKNIKDAVKSDLIITNHAYLLSDIFNERSIFPPFDYVVVDEAHHLEDVAIEQLGTKMEYTTIQHLLQRYIEGINEMSRISALSKSFSLEAVTTIQNIKAEVDDLFRLLRSLVLKKDRTYNEIGRLSYVYNVKEEQGILWDSIREIVKRIRFMILESNENFKKIAEGMKQNLNMKEFIEMQKQKDELDRIAYQLKEMLLDEHLSKISWIESEEKGALNAATLYQQPFEVNEVLKSELFLKKKSVIITSATLAVKGDFEYTCNRIGLDPSSVLQLQIPSPFSFKDQVKVMIPEDIPNIKDVDEVTFAHEIAEKLKRIATCTEGNMLVLFTSYNMLRQTYLEIKSLVTPEEFNIIAQGISSGSRNKLIRNFTSQDRSILFGTNSFWEGIDIPGKDLSCLVIVRLPFVSPDQPIFNARADKIKKEGKNVFYELSLPQAVLRFKQGFGRLIRTKNDKGVVFIFDKRITSSKYGRSFLKSIPPIEIEKENTEQLIEKIKRWL